MNYFELVLKQVLKLEIDTLRKFLHSEDLLCVDLPDYAYFLVLANAQELHLRVLGGT